MKPHTVLSSITLAAGLTLSLALPLFAEEATIKDISVKAEIDTANGANALTYYPQVEADLAQAIAGRVPVSDAPNGYVVQVMLQSMTLDGDSVLPDSMEFNRMEGVALVTSPLTNTAPETIPIQIAAYSGDGPALDGYTVVEPSVDDFYVSMVMAFAELVANDIPEFVREDAAR